MQEGRGDCVCVGGSLGGGSECGGVCMCVLGGSVYKSFSIPLPVVPDVVCTVVWVLRGNPSPTLLALEGGSGDGWRVYAR